MSDICLVKLLFYEQFGWVLPCENCAMECDKKEVAENE